MHAIALPAAAQTPDITGTWTVNAILDSGPLPPSKLTLNREGTKIVGTQGTAFHVTYVGTADPTSMKGAVKLGDLGEGTFTGKKK